MTRINLINPICLVNEHLMAEYRELPRIFSYVLRETAKGKTLQNFTIPTEYKLGAGHVMFFINKLNWLMTRWETIIIELETRNYQLSPSFIEKVRADFENCPREFYGKDYTPTPEEIYLNMQRISERYFTSKQQK